MNGRNHKSLSQIVGVCGIDDVSLSFQRRLCPTEERATILVCHLENLVEIELFFKSLFS